MVGLNGFEPLTSRLSGGRSNQLSYRPARLHKAAVELLLKKERVTLVPGASTYACHPVVHIQKNAVGPMSNLSVRKEVIQPQVPLRLPCYDLVPITELAFGAVLPKVRQSDFERSPLSWLDGRCVQGSGTYSPRHG